MEILYADKDIAVCVKPVGLDSEAEVPAALKDILGGEISVKSEIGKGSTFTIILKGTGADE